VHWCVMKGIINGKDGKLVPAGNATRAEVATMLMRFVMLG
ncbi:MAG: S-layer homology domain-containing protein, partial [Clostridia bacterium]|nr:S-layer homology domain-containing protein [Clostridia bacterium]